MKEESILTLIMTVGTGLSGAVVFLFSIVMKQNTKQTQISREIGELKGKQEGIATLSSSVLTTVHEAIVVKNDQDLKTIVETIKETQKP